MEVYYVIQNLIGRGYVGENEWSVSFKYAKEFDSAIAAGIYISENIPEGHYHIITVYEKLFH